VLKQNSVRFAGERIPLSSVIGLPESVPCVHVTVKLIEARVRGGKSTYFFFFGNNSYHIKDVLERTRKIDKIDEYFVLPCKYFTRKVIEMLFKNDYVV
jgi:hypothetical protein